jgi:hypothetical protein
MKGIDMSSLSKFTFKTFAGPATSNPTERRRSKLLAAIEAQKLVLAAALKGTSHMQPSKKGERAVRPWFVAGDGGVYVYCRYGTRIVPLSEQGSAVFVSKMDEVAAVLTAFAAATKAGELDAALANAATKPAKKQG